MKWLIAWHPSYRNLRAENARLKAENAQLVKDLAAAKWNLEEKLISAWELGRRDTQYRQRAA